MSEIVPPEEQEVERREWEAEERNVERRRGSDEAKMLAVQS